MNKADLYMLKDKTENPHHHFVSDDKFIVWVQTEGMPSAINEIEILQDELRQADILIATLTPSDYEENNK